MSVLSKRFIFKPFILSDNQSLYVIIFLFAFVILGCSGCLGTKPSSSNNHLHHKKANSSDALSNENPALGEDKRNFSNFPGARISYDNPPKAEIVLDSIGYNGYMFDHEGKFLGIINDEIVRQREPKVSFDPDGKNDNNDIPITEKNRVLVKENLEKIGFDIPESVLKNAVQISPNTLGYISFNKDIYSNKVVGFTYQLEITIIDKSNCIFDYRLVKIFDYKNQLIRTLSDKEIGKNLILSKNQNVGFSTFIQSTCDSYEPDFFLAYERYSNFKTGYQFDFFPIDTILHRDYLYSRHEFMELRDSVVKYFYLNSPKFLRVVVEPYTRKVFIKEFDPSKEFDGKYNQVEYIRSLINGKLPNGTVENYRSYNIVNQK